MLTMDDVTEIRRRVARGESMRTVAASLGVSRNTVRRYVDGARPETRRAAATPRARPKQEAVGARLRELLAESATWTAGKQRLIAARLHSLLRAEGHEVGLTLARALVAGHWRQLRAADLLALCTRPGAMRTDRVTRTVRVAMCRSHCRGPSESPPPPP
ncbi:MAG: helix-turn-helix domain-containing protein [Bradymonadia bacterium]